MAINKASKIDYKKIKGRSEPFGIIPDLIDIAFNDLAPVR